MNGWRKQIIDQIQISLHSLILVTDPDDLLSDEELILCLQDMKVDVQEVEDRADLRFIYENHSADKMGILLLKRRGNDKYYYPYDLMKIGHNVHLSVIQLFPKFSAPIIRQLDTDVIDALYSAFEQPQGSLSNKETCNYLLRKIYKLPYDLVETEAEWISLLIQLHSNKYRVPAVLKDHLINYIDENTSINKQFRELAQSQTALFDFLQEEWNRFVIENLNDGITVKDGTKSDVYYKKHPFQSDQLKAALQHFFIEGKLQSIEMKDDRHVPHWAINGVRKRSYDPSSDILYIINKVNERLTQEKLQYKQWLEIIDLYSHAKEISLKYDLEDNLLSQIDEKIDETFKQWMLLEYKALPSLSYYNGPIMVHQIIPFMQLHSEQKQALIVMDGMSFIQWKQIKNTLTNSFSLEEAGVFAWVPTITEISRSSIFQGKIPKFHKSHKEEKAWKQAWMKEAISSLHITFENILSQGAYSKSNFEVFNRSNNKKAAIIIRNIDTLLHGAIQGLRGLYAEMEVWLKTGYLESLLEDLISEGYEVYLTSDHGNKESSGVGRVAQGSLVETKGERARIYKDKVFRDEAANQYSSISWPNYGFSDDQHFLLAESKEAFVTSGKEIVSHGGISLEEVIVPFIKVNKKE